MGLNLKALKDVQEDLQNRGGGGLFFNASDIEEETDIRILPPLPKLNGIYFIEQIGYWINKKYYVSPATFGEDCPIEEEIEEAKALRDPDINEVLNSNSIQKKSRFYIPVLVLDCKFDNKNRLKSFKVVDGKAKILVTGPMLMKAINKVVLSRAYQNDTEDGILDREEGYNIILNKTGKKLDTDYTAIGWTESTEMDEKYYETENIPDIQKITEDEIKSKKYLRGIIRNFLYGEPLPKDESKSKNSNRDEDEEEERTTRKSSRFKEEEEQPVRRRSSRREEEEEEEEETTKKYEKPKRSSKVEEYEEEEEAPKKTSNKRKPKDDEEEEEEIETKPKKTPKNPKEELEELEEKPSKKIKKESEEEEEEEVENKPKRRNIFKDLGNID